MKKILIFIVFLIGLTTTFLIPPFAKPDEPVHFQKTLEVAGGKFICKNKEEYQTNSKFKTIHKLSNKYQFASDKSGIFYIGEYKIPIFEQKKEFARAKTIYCHLNSIPYIFLATGIILGELLNLNGIFSFFLGRFFNFVTIFFVISFISLKSGKFFWFFFIPLSLPITLHQLSAYSYDGVTILFFFLFSYFYLKYLEARKKILYFIFASFFIFLGILSKNLFYFPLVILLIPELVINIKNQKIKKHRLTLLIITILVFFAFILLVTNKIILPNLIKPENLLFKSIINSNIQLEILKNYPDYFLSVFLNNLLEKQELFINSLIGNLEWLSFLLSPLVIYLYFAFIAKTITLKVNLKINKINLIFIILSFLLFIILIFFYLYLHWTPLGAKTIEGFQGRYLLPLLPIIMLVLNYLYQNYKKPVLISIFILIFFIIIYDIYKKHYDYSKSINFSNLPNITNKKLDLKNNNYQQKFKNSSGKKILAFYYSYSGQKPNPPFSIEIYDYQCNKLLNYNIVSAGSLNKDIIFVKPIKNTDFCLKINTFGINIKENKYLFNLLSKDNQEYLFYPLYSF